MDPNACIQRAIDALMENEVAEFREAMNDYHTWIKNGGFAASEELLAKLETTYALHTDTDGFDTFLEGYVECLLFTGMTYAEDGELEMGELETLGYTLEDFPEYARTEIETDCRDFFDANYADFDGNFSQAGHDFCLTRNGHGAGFWDGDWPEPEASRLTENSKAYGSQNVLYCPNTDTLELTS